MLQAAGVPELDEVLLAGPPAVAVVVPVAEQVRIDAVLVVEERQVLVQRDFQAARRHSGGHVEELHQVEIVRRGERGEAEVQERARGQRVGGVEGEIPVHGLCVRAVQEMLHCAEVPGEDAVGAESLEATVVSLLAGLLHPRRRDDRPGSRRAHVLHRDPEPHQLHEVELHLVEPKAERNLYLLQGAQQRDEPGRGRRGACRQRRDDFVHGDARSHQALGPVRLTAGESLDERAPHPLQLGWRNCERALQVELKPAKLELGLSEGAQLLADERLVQRLATRGLQRYGALHLGAAPEIVACIDLQR